MTSWISSSISVCRRHVSPAIRTSTPSVSALDLVQRVDEPTRRDPEIEETGAGNFCALDLLELCGTLGELSGELARRPLVLRRRLQGDVGGVVPVGRVARPLELDRCARDFRQARLEAH